MEENPYNLPLSIRKFVTIASVLAMDGSILVFDEPTAGQDLHGIRCLEGIFRELERKGKTVVTITHDMEFVVNNFDMIYVMAHKNLLMTGDASSIFGDQNLLDESMLKEPYVGTLARLLGLPANTVDTQTLIDRLQC